MFNTRFFFLKKQNLSKFWLVSFFISSKTKVQHAQKLSFSEALLKFQIKTKKNDTEID